VSARAQLIRPFSETYGEMAVWATQFEEVIVARAHDELVKMKLAAVVELDGQVGVCGLVEQVLELDVGLHG
jgi:flavin-binding protein dodecin